MKLRAQPWLASILFALFTLPASAVTVDLLVLYDSYTSTYFNNQPATAIKSWVDQMNVMNQNSKVDVQWRLVGAELHDDSSTAQGTVLNNIRLNASVSARRDALGADYVTQLHKSGSCGVAYVAVDKNWSYSVVGPTCGPNTMAHELGHNMGLSHSRAQGDTGGSRYAYGLGHGVDGKFATLMAYSSAYHTSTTPKYSNPNNTCAGLPCGVPEGQPLQADAAKAINNVRNEMAAFLPTKVIGGGGTTAGVTVYQNYSFGGYSATLASGSYRLSDLQAKGILNDDLSSAKVPAGFTLELYSYDNFGGVKTVYTADNSGFPSGVNDTTSSIIVKSGTPTNGTYEFRAKHSGLCMDVRTSGTGDGVAIQQYTCNSTAAQAWLVTDTGSGKFEIKSKVSNKCMDVSGVSTADLAPIHQWTCLRTNNQLWNLIDNGDGTVRLQAVHSGKVADVNGGSTQPGVQLIQYGWTGSQNQRWTMRRIN